MTDENSLAKAPKPRRTVFVSLRIKVLVAFTLVFFAVFAGAFYWFYNFASDQAERRIQADMVDTLTGAARNISGDDLIALYKSGQGRADGYSDDPRYWAHVNFLAQVAEIEPRAQLYTWVKGPEENQIIYIGSSGAVQNPPWGVKFLEKKISTGSLLKGLSETTFKLVDDKGNFGYHDEFGYWITGRIPITDKAGEKVGALGIDFHADYVLEVQRAIRDRVILAFGVTYAVLLLLVLLLSGALTRPISRLTRIAERIGEGDYDQDLPSSGSRVRDEINTLSAVFAIMVDKVYQREQALRQQVEELKIEIDETRRQMQVNEIVESDFFQGLQERARTMRQRKRQATEETPAVPPAGTVNS
jgi:HAMP domain-containing protein